MTVAIWLAARIRASHDPVWTAGTVPAVRGDVLGPGGGRMSTKDDGIDVNEVQMYCGNCGQAHDGGCVTVRGVIREVLRKAIRPTKSRTMAPTVHRRPQ